MATTSALSAPSRPLRTFLQSCKHLLASKPQPPLHLTLVVGNEAADADSVVSSICLAFLKREVARGSSHPTVPIANIPKTELPLRRDLCLLLNKVQIDVSDLCCFEDINSFINESVSEVVLTDHNLLPSNLRHFEERVLEIVDHHVDMGAYPWVTGDRRLIEFEDSQALVGSTCTLVAQKFIAEAPTLLSSDVAFLLTGVILLDTINMDERIGKGTQQDAAALTALRGYLRSEWPDFDQNSLFEELSNAKLDLSFWRSLPVLGCLRMDYKEFTAGGGALVGISSVLLPIQDVISKELFAETLCSFMAEKSLSSLHIMTLYKSDEGGIRREVVSVVYQPDAERFSRHLIGYTALQLDPLDLDLQEETCSYIQSQGCAVLAFSQGNSQMSRKQIAPIVLEYYTAQTS